MSAERSPSEGAEDRRAGTPVLGLVAPLAGLAVPALLLGRAVAPSIAGLGVGMESSIRALEIAGSAISQLFALAAVVVATRQISAATTGRLPPALRVASIALGGFVVLMSLWASVMQIPGSTATIAALSAIVLALAASHASFAVPFARGPAALLGLVAVASMVRLAAVAVAYQAAEPAWSRAAPVARAFATVAFALQALSLCGAVAWVALQAPALRGAPDPGEPPAARRVTSPVTLIVLGLSLLLTRQALLGQAEDPSRLDLLLWRASGQLVVRPDPLIPLGIRVFVGFLGPVAALGALLARAPVPSLAGALALALLARISPEVPISALLLVVASLGVALAAHDDRAVWASIAARTRGR